MRQRHRSRDHVCAKLTESDIEALAIERLQALGYDYVCAPDIAPDGDAPERQDYGEVLLTFHVDHKHR